MGRTSIPPAPLPPRTQGCTRPRMDGFPATVMLLSFMRPIRTGLPRMSRGAPTSGAPRKLALTWHHYPTRRNRPLRSRAGRAVLGPAARLRTLSFGSAAPLGAARADARPEPTCARPMPDKSWAAADSWPRHTDCIVPAAEYWPPSLAYIILAASYWPLSLLLARIGRILLDPPVRLLFY